MSALPAKNERTWINDRAGTITVDDKTYNIGVRSWSHNEEMEKRVLCCILLAGVVGNGCKAMRQVSYLDYRDFFLLRNGTIFRAMQTLAANATEIDLATVSHELSRHRHGDKTLLDLVGGDLYLAEVVNAVPSPANLEAYAQVVVDCSLRRDTMLAGDVIQSIGSNTTIDADQRAHDIQMAVRELLVRSSSLTERNTHTLYDALTEYAQQALAEAEDENYQPAIPSGFASLDQIIIGWRKERLYIVAAPTGWGKTSFFLSTALNALRAGKRVLYIFLEMPLEEIVERCVCNQARIDSVRLAKRQLDDGERLRLQTAVAELQGLRQSQAFLLVRMKWPTIHQIRAKLDELELNPGYDLVILDYASVNTISDDGSAKNDDFRHMSNIYVELEKIKQDYHVPVIVGTQMNNRWVERPKKQKGRPELEDMYYGSIGKFAADCVLFIYHESKINDLPETDMAEIITKKNRGGPVQDAVAELIYEPQYYSFSTEGVPDL